MKEEKNSTIVNGVEIQFGEFGTGIGGDVIIDLPDTGKIGGSLIEGGLAGNVIIPGTINDPESPVVKTQVPGISEKLAGNVVITTDLPKVFDLLAALKDNTQYINSLPLPIKDREKLTLLYLDGKFHLNEEYYDNENLTPEQKLQGINDSITNSLYSTRTHLVELQEHLEEQKKGLDSKNGFGK